jgi:hypothetical protein
MTVKFISIGPTQKKDNTQAGPEILPPPQGEVVENIVMTPLL